ncbi:MAG TPA: alpha/beta hydrolase [Hanamia sp.]|nr:alpha/beta hydrolase [Hanamia sp.]
MTKSEIKLDLSDISVAANLSRAKDPVAMVIFAHGSGSSHLSPRNNFVADVLNQNHISTLLVDLLTPEEDKIYENRFNIDLLTDRLIRVTEKALEQFTFNEIPLGYFGASTGAASALDAAAFLGDTIKAVVSRGGRPDLSKNLKKVKAPTLLIIGSLDNDVIELNKQAYQQLNSDRKIEIVDGASHLFEEPGTLNEVANLAAAWFDLYLCNNMVQNQVQ